MLKREAEPVTTLETPETKLPAQASKHTIATFHDYLIEDLKSRGQEIAIPEPSAVIVEVYNILAGEGYEVAPIAYVDGKRKKVRFGVFESVARPDYTNGTQMYYAKPDGGTNDPLADILVRGREKNEIAVPDYVRHVPGNSRFAVSWDEINKCIAPEAIKTTSHLAEQLTKGGIILDVPDLADFRSAGQGHADKLVATNSWEWVKDSAGLFGGHRVAGRRGGGGPPAVLDWRPIDHFGYVAFRLQAVSPSQKLP